MAFLTGLIEFVVVCGGVGGGGVYVQMLAFLQVVISLI